MANIPGNLEQILRYASFAPSSHNSQPWKVKVLLGSGLEFVVQSDSSRWLPRVDPTNREVLLSIGAFWENLCQAASAFGFEVHAEIMAANAADADILKVKLVKYPHPYNHPPEMLTLMENRSTSRRKYKKKALFSSHLEECKKLIPGNLTYFSRESEKGKWIAAGLVEAMRQQAFHDGKQKELVDWLRFSRSQVAERGDGITAEMLGLPGIFKFTWYTFMTPKIALSKIFRSASVKSMKTQVTHCAGFFVITSEDVSVQSLLHAGREFERLAHKCIRLNIQVQPVSQLIQEEPFNRRLNDELGLSKPIQWIVRVGYSDSDSDKHPEPGICMRRPVNDFAHL